MVDLSPYNLTIGRASDDIDDWFLPIMDRGRGAAFVDTGFLRGLFFDSDQYASRARAHFSRASGNFYTTNLVLAEIVRQISKDKETNFYTRNIMFDRCSELLIDSRKVFVCSPPEEIVLNAYDELRIARASVEKLDMCDLMSIVVLNYAQHRRVFGFDGHFNSFGASLEP